MHIIDQKISLLLVVLFSPILILFFHILFSRLAHIIKINRPPQLICIMSAVFANGPFFALMWIFTFNLYRPDELVPAISSMPSLLYAFIVFNLMGYTYFHIFNMSETARRVRILYDIYTRGSITKVDIEKSYHKEDMVAVRLQRLLGLGQIRKVNGAYFLDRRLLYYAAILLAFWSRLIGLSILPEGYKKNRP